MSYQARNRLSVSGRTATESPHVGVSEDETFEILASSRRRFVVRYLNEFETASTEEIARQLAAVENNKDPADVSRQEYRNVRIPLVQTHLPRLKEAGVVEYESTQLPIQAGAELETITEHLGTTSTWSRLTEGFAQLVSH